MIPPDKKRCQAEIPNRATAFTLGGTPERVRCTNIPKVIIEETTAGKDGLFGSMSLCDDCLKVAYDQLPKGYFHEKENL